MVLPDHGFLHSDAVGYGHSRMHSLLSITEKELRLVVTQYQRLLSHEIMTSSYGILGVALSMAY